MATCQRYRTSVLQIHHAISMRVVMSPATLFILALFLRLHRQNKSFRSGFIRLGRQLVMPGMTRTQ